MKTSRDYEINCDRYWYANTSRWRKILQVCADYADMYELARPTKDAMDRLHPSTLARQFFWNTTHRRRALGILKTGSDPVTDTEPYFDGPTAWACICGDLRSMTLSRIDIPFLLDSSAGRVNSGWALWDTFSSDFKVAVRGLRGDMSSKALRCLVLGDAGRRRHG
jgi:hypothetical protein|tara:strand:- start:1169 stop:1663 length:495 start_codon:yes stop_codon:yes gene_type:complete